MQTIFKQKIGKLLALLVDRSERNRELLIRRNAREVENNYNEGINTAPFPQVVLLVVNEHCNQKCLACDIGRKDNRSFYYRKHFKGKGMMSKDTFTSIVSSVKDKGTELWLLATEPLLYPHLYWAIEYATSRGVKVQLTTNGYLLPDMAEKLVDTGITRICLSIDGHTAELHDQIRVCPGSFEKVIIGLEKIIKAKKTRKTNKPYVHVNTVVSKWNYKYLDEIVKRFFDYDIEGINISHFQYVTEEMAEKHSMGNDNYSIESGRNSALMGQEGIDVDVLDEKLNYIREKYRKYRVNETPLLPTRDDLYTYYFLPEKPIKKYKVCYMPWRYPHILANGDVIVNYQCFSRSMGNINENTLQDIWGGEEFCKFRDYIMGQKGSTPACLRCPMIYCGYKL